MPLFIEHVFRYPFLQTALLAGLLASIACGIVGSYVVVRRTTYIAGAVSHCLLAGMAGARYLRLVHGVHIVLLQRTVEIDGRSTTVDILVFPTPLQGAAIAALVAAGCIAIATIYGRERIDSVLSAIWALGMSIGVSLIAITPGYSEDLAGYLFGSILLVGWGDLWLMVALDVVVIVLFVLFYNRFLVIAFHEELARLRGIRVLRYELLSLLLIALTVVLLVQIVGIVMVIALLALPAATAGLFAHRLGTMMIAATVLCMVLTVGGLALSYAPEWPAGATIVQLSGILYVLALAGRAVWRKIQRLIGAYAVKGEKCTIKQ